MKTHAALLTGLLLTSPPAGADAPEEDGKLSSLFLEHLRGQFELRPTSASGLGERSFDDRLDDVSAAARERWVGHARATLEQLPQRVDRALLSRDGQIDYEIFEHQLRRTLWSAENLNPWVEDPRVYGGLVTGAIFGLLTQSTLPAEQNVANAVSRMAGIPAVLAAARESLGRPPRPHAETAIAQNRGAIRFFREGIFGLIDPALHGDALRAAASSVAAALEDYQTFLEQELLPRSDGGWRLGAETFEEKFRWETRAGLSAADNQRIALAEFDRVRHELYVISRQAWSACHPGEPLPPDDADGRRETIARVLGHYENDHGQPEALAADARATVDAIREFIRERDILRLPEPDRCEVIEMPEFQRGNSVAYMNSPPPFDPEAAGYYAIAPPPASWDEDRVRAFMREYNAHMLQILTIHEAYPGHYVQMEYANRHPSLIRRIFGCGVFIEGWAVYTEQMMLDQGYGGADNHALRLNQLKFYLRAIANNILDYRMHCEEMSDEEAMDLLVRESFQTEGEARLKVVRSKQSSVQLSTYFTGRMALVDLRRRIQREMGDDFSLGRFHEAVIGHGSVPVMYLEELVRRQLGLAAP
jgi:uncharacterized protein (DUF885 family)